LNGNWKSGAGYLVAGNNRNGFGGGSGGSNANDNDRNGKNANGKLHDDVTPFVQVERRSNSDHEQNVSDFRSQVKHIIDFRKYVNL